MSGGEVDKHKIITKNRHLNKLNEIFPQDGTGYKFSYLNSKNRFLQSGWNIWSINYLRKFLKNRKLSVHKFVINFDIKSNPFKDNIIEVNTILRIVPNEDVKHKILTEINITALVSIDNKFSDKAELEKIVLIKIPTEIYPTLYETFVYLFTQAGIKNIKIDKEVNFEKMYNERKKT